MTHSMNKLLAALALIGSATLAGAAPIATTSYHLSSITGTFAWGQTDWNAVSSLGSVNNTTDLATVNAMMSDGYAFMAGGSGAATANGIYNWPVGGYNALTFTFDGGANHVLDSLSFVSSRSYAANTSIAVDVMLDGGAWVNALTTTAGALGISTGSGNTYTLNLGGVSADAFRFVLQGGNQVSVHEIGLAGSAAATVPEPASFALVALALAGVGFARTRRR